MRIAVLGSNSFAGCDFVDLLLETGGFDVLGISRSPEKAAEFLPYAHRGRDRFTYLQLDLNVDFERIAAALEGFEPQFIVNYAAQGDDRTSWLHPEDFFQTNCVALSRLVDRLKEQRSIRRFLQISSSGVYGNPPAAITEDTHLAPLSPYGASKAAADLLLLAYGKNFDFPVQIVRPPNLYGPYQQLYRIIPKSVIWLRRGRPIELHGGGTAVRPYLHVRDASRAILATLERGAPLAVYNISPDGQCSVADLLALTCEVMGKDFSENTVTVDDARAQSSVVGFDSSKIRSELGWRPRISLRTGIEQIRDWIDREWDRLMEHQLVYTHTK